MIYDKVITNMVRMKFETFNYRFAEQLFESPEYQEKKYQIIDIIRRSQPMLRDADKIRKKGNKCFDIKQDSLNKWFKKEFVDRGWEDQPLITTDGITKLAADFKKEGVQIEIQFGNMARWYADIFKMQVSYSQNLIDVGVLIVPKQSFANRIGENIVYFERVARELPYAKLSITLPIWVIGISP